MADDTDTDACDGKQWGFVAYDVADAPKCISLCRQQFLRALLSSSKDAIQNTKEEDETLFIQVCETLSDSSRQWRRRSGNRKDQPFFWDLYCCDAQRCGVDNVERLGEDPSINWIINTCSNIGFKSIVDPGPPDATYTCSSEAVHGHNNPQCQRLKDTSHRTTTTSSSRSIEVITQDTMVPTITRGILSDSTISSIVDPSLTASNVPDSQDGEDDRDGYSTGEKVALSVSVVVGIVIIVVAIFCLFRIRTLRKRRSRPIDPNQDENTPSSPPPPASSFSPSTPPISLNESDGAPPLTPPPRLKERRLLSSGLSTRSWSPATSIHHNGFPESPLYSPMRAKLIPRREEMKKVASIQTAPLLSHRTWPREDVSIRSGNSSYTAGSSTHSGRIRPEPIHRSSLATTGATGHVRHPSRVHSLASPGPAPNKKLPPTPPFVESSRNLSANSAGRRHGNFGVAVGIVEHNPARGVTLTGPARDLCELTEEYEQETGSSGSSWSAKGGGGGPGVALTSGKRMELRGVKAVLREDDLQKMGGKY